MRRVLLSLAAMLLAACASVGERHDGMVPPITPTAGQKAGWAKSLPLEENFVSAPNWVRRNSEKARKSAANNRPPGPFLI